MVILDADRFGVSQLHQLRGRIGRGGHAGLCLLVTAADPASTSMERLVAVAGTRDGFELSRIDLEQRREGNVLGTEQSGGRGSGLKLLSVLRDEDVIERARAAATDHLARDPELARGAGSGHGGPPARGLGPGRVPGDGMSRAARCAHPGPRP